MLSTAEQAFRRPLTPEDEDSLLGVYDAVLAEGGSIADAAHHGDLESLEGIRDQVVGLLASPEVRANLETAMFAYFQLGTLDTVVIDPARAPTFDDGLRTSMRYEAKAFLRNALWPGTLTALLTGREPSSMSSVGQPLSARLSTIRSNAQRR